MSFIDDTDEAISGHKVVLVDSDELARLREIAGCFADGDSDALKRVVDYMNYMYPRSSPYFGCAADIVMLERLQAAAKLAEGRA